MEALAHLMLIAVSDCSTCVFLLTIQSDSHLDIALSNPHDNAMRPIKHLSLPGYGFAKNLDIERRKLLSQWGEFFAFDEGEILVTQGERHDSLFMVLEGVLLPERIINPHSIIPLRAIKRGGIFGEINLFDPAGARATVKATTDGELWKISSERLNSWLDTDFIICREILTWLCGKFARRVRRLDDRYAATREELDQVADDGGEDEVNSDV